MLRIDHYSKTYPGGKRAVDDLTLHVRPGEIYGFIGHNGAGKTTTLRAVAGVMDFTEGNYRHRWPRYQAGTGGGQAGHRFPARQPGPLRVHEGH